MHRAEPKYHKLTDKASKGRSYAEVTKPERPNSESPLNRLEEAIMRIVHQNSEIIKYFLRNSLTNC